MSNITSSPRKQQAFTLLELLIALTLSTMILLMLVVGMNIVVKDWERSNNRLENDLDQVLILLQIERALNSAYPHTYLDEDKNQRLVFFMGEEEKLTWISTISPGRQSGLTAWQLMPSGEKSGIALRVVPAFAHNPMENLKAIEKPKIIFEGFKVRFEYLYVDPKFENDSEWLEEWEGEERRSLPNAIRVVLENQEDKDHSLEIVAFVPTYQHENIRPVKP